MITYDLYLRISDARIEGAFEGRVAKLTAFGDSLGWVLHRVIRENDVDKNGRPKPAGAWKTRLIKLPNGRIEYRNIRPGFAELIDEITTGVVNGAIFEDIDRAFRNTRDCDDLLDACQYTGANIRSLSDRFIITNGGTNSERSQAKNYAQRAEDSSNDTSRRVAQGRERWNGKSYFGGPRPYGYVHDPNAERYGKMLFVVPDERDILLKAADDILNKDISINAIISDLRERNVPTAHGGQWRTQTLKRALLKATVAGLSLHTSTVRDDTTGEVREIAQLEPAPWDAILERHVWEQLKEKLEDPARRTNTHGNEPRWLLSWNAKCGACGVGPIVVTGRKRDNGSCYVCKNCWRISRRADKTDEWVERNVTAYISRRGMDILKPEPREDIDTTELRKEIKELQERKTKLITMFSLGQIDEDQLVTGSETARKRLTAIEAQLARANKPDPIPEFRRHGPTRQIWASLSLARKRALIKLLVDVTILPVARRGPGFDPGTVEIIDKETGERIDVRQWPETNPVS
jgi:site-specific DNA recombinase